MTVISIILDALEEFGIAPCGDNSCMFGAPGGMATNGGCRCLERLDGPRMSSDQRIYFRKLAAAMRAIAARVAVLEAKQ